LAGDLVSVRRRANPVNSDGHRSRHGEFSQLRTPDLLAARPPAPNINTRRGQTAIKQTKNKSLQLYFRNLVY
jgi:hypothetical protein